MKEITILAAAAIAAARVLLAATVDPEPASVVGSYEAVAHLFVGGLFVSAIHCSAPWKWRLFWGLCVLEVAAAVLSRL